MGTQLPSAQIEQFFHTGDLQSARRTADALQSVRARQLAGELLPDHALLEARLRLMLADTVGARRQVERLATNLAALGTDAFDRIPSAAAIGRSFLLFSRLGGPRASDINGALSAIWKGGQLEIR